MRVRVSSLFVAVLLVPTVAFADYPKVDFSGGGSGGTGGSGVGGFAQSLSWNFRKWFTCPSCGFVIPDVSVQFGKHNISQTPPQTIQVTQVAYQAGFRWTPTSLHHREGYEDSKTKVFIQVLAGGVYTNDGNAPTAPANNKVITLGGGVQHFFHKEDRTTKAGRVEPHCSGIGIQAQFDKVWRSEREGFWRLSGGVVYRFLHKNGQ